MQKEYQDECQNVRKNVYINICQKVCLNICQKVCLNRYQIECQIECQSECHQIECPNKIAIYIPAPSLGLYFQPVWDFQPERDSGRKSACGLNSQILLILGSVPGVGYRHFNPLLRLFNKVPLPLCLALHNLLV